MGPMATINVGHMDGTFSNSQGMTMYVLNSRTDLQLVTDLEGAIVSSRAYTGMSA